MSKKKILIFIDWYLPGYRAGGPIQSVANLVAHLKNDFDISIITRDTDYSETTPYEDVRSNKWLAVNDVRVHYISKDQLNYSTIYKLIEENKVDYVYLNGIYSLYFTLIPLFILRKKRGQHIIIAARGMLSPGSLNVKKTKKSLFLRMIKIAKLFNGVIFHATTNAENNDIRSMLGDKITIKTAGNLPSVQNHPVLTLREKKPGSVYLVNIARIAPEKNLLTALKILQHVKSNITFDFYGPVYDQSYWEQCKEVLFTLPSHVKAVYKGSLESAKVMDVLSKAHFMFMPTTGENFGHIILQSLSAGCPVIISDQTPWKQLEQMNCGWDVSLAEPEKFVQVIERTTTLRQQEYDQLSQSAFAFAAKYMDNPQTLVDNKDLFGG